jgi:hypothetical protein
MTERVTLEDSKFRRNCCDNFKYNKFQTAFEEKWHITEGTTLLRKIGRIFRACVVSGCQAVRNITKRSRQDTVNCSSLFANATNVFFYRRDNAGQRSDRISNRQQDFNTAMLATLSLVTAP